jgi:hypothetical protein
MNSVACGSTAARSTARLAVFTIWAATAGNSHGQAWGPPAGEGSVSFSYQRIDNTGHRLTDGFLVPGGQSLNMWLYVEGEYALTNRLSFTAGLPYVFSKYTDPNPPPPALPYLPVDQCHCWHAGWQDFGFTARYHLVDGVFALTPSVSFGAPSHDYNFRGEAALGRDLRELRIAIDAGQRLDPISKNLSVQERYSYAFVERVQGIPDNRSNATLEGTYLVKRKLAPSGFLSWQRTHGGLRLGSLPPASLVFPGEVNTLELLTQHDRLLRDNYWRAGGGLSYSFPNVDLFASYTAYLSGTDTHAGRALTLGFSIPFQLRSAHH